VVALQLFSLCLSGSTNRYRAHSDYLAAADWDAADAKCGTLETLDEYLACSAFQLPQSGLKFNNYNINPALWFKGNVTYKEPGVRISHLGVLSHEMGHFLGLPDYYDTDYSSFGLDQYCLMYVRCGGMDSAMDQTYRLAGRLVADIAGRRA
jgi:M6 family metalloprotease-like protein